MAPKMKSSFKGGSGFKGGGRDRPGKSRFRYEPRSGEDVQRRADQKGGQYDSIFRSGVDRWRPKDGENVIRILPPTWVDPDHYGYDIWVHAFVGPDKSTYLCPQKMKNEPCPICKASRDARNAGEEDEAKALAPSRRVVVWIIDRNEEKSTPALFDMSWSMDRDIAALCHNKRTGKVLLIDHPDQGYDVMFQRTGKGLNTRYIGMAIDREESPVMSDEGDQEQVLEYIQENSIPDQLNFYDEDYLSKMIEGGSDERDEELDEEESRGKRAATRGARRPTRREEPENEEEEEKPPRGRATARSQSRREEPEDEEVEEEEVGGRASDDRSRRPSRREEPEDSDVDPDADEYEEEEEAPSRSRPSSRRVRPGDEDPEELDEEEAPPPSSKKSTGSRRR